MQRQSQQHQLTPEQAAVRDSIVASISHLTLQVAVFDRGKPASPQISAPFLSIPSIEFKHAENGCTFQEDQAGSSKPELALEVASVSVAAAPRQLEVCQQSRNATESEVP